MIDNVKQYLILKEKKAELENILKDVNKSIEALAQSLLEQSIEEQVSKIDVGNVSVSIALDSEYTFPGGKNPTARNNVIAILVEAGYLDETKVERYEVLECHKGTLQAAIKKLAPENINQIVSAGQMSVWAKPKITVREK